MRHFSKRGNTSTVSTMPRVRSGITFTIRRRRIQRSPNRTYGGGVVANNFKIDDSCLRKLAVGTAGTNATIDRLKTMGFNPIELERGFTGFKIWKIKISHFRGADPSCSWPP